MDWKEILNCIFLFPAPAQGLMFTPAMHFLTLCLSVAGRGARGWNILVRSAAAVCGGNWAANVIVYLALPRVIFTQILFYHSSPVPV